MSSPDGRRMRVALLTNFIPPYRLSLFRAIARQAGELRVFVSTRMEQDRSWVPDWSGLDVVVQRTFTVNHKWGNSDFTEITERHFPYDTLLQLQRWSPDVIIAGELGARSMQAIWYGRLTGTPVVLWATLSDYLEAGRSQLVHTVRAHMVRRAAAVIVNGESGARYIKRLGLSEEQLLRIPCTTDMQTLFELPASKSAMELLYAGSLSERKGVHKFLDGLAEYARRNSNQRIRLTVVGDGPMRPRLQQQPIPQNVAIRWVGAVPYEDLPRWFADGSVFVFPTLGDEWGVVVNEAMAAGLPVLGSTYSQAVEELVRDGENGWLFQPDSVENIVTALTRVYATSDAMLARMREIARATARTLEPQSVAQRIVNRLAALVAA
jgi:glycosyltransferase involved in cell wall biosynthesis